MSGIELFALQMARRVREHNAEVDRINSENERRNMTVQPHDPAPTKPKTPKAPVSVLASLSIGLLILGFVTVLAATIMSLPYLLALGGFDALAAITLAVLSLREKN